MDINLRIAQLLVSRVCHDLAGGLGALRAGAELLNEENSVPSGETLDLILCSAEQTVHALKFLRVAVGAGGTDGQVITLAQLKTLAGDHLEGKRFSITWESEVEVLPLEAGKFLLLLCLIASEAVPRGGSVCVEIRDLDPHMGFAIRVQGEGARVSAQLQAALLADTESLSVQADAENLSARTVYGYFAAVLAEKLGANVEIETDLENEVRFAAMLPWT